MPEDRSTQELVRELATQTTTLVRKELALAQVELTEKGKRAGVGGGLFGTAGVLALLGAGALVACAILALDTAVAGWLAALIVGAVLLGAAGAVALAGRSELKKAAPAKPEQTVASVQADVREVRERAEHA
jgi:uncharacterized membrane protein YqjE